jgi:hypothetical protein
MHSVNQINIVFAAIRNRIDEYKGNIDERWFLDDGMGG